MQLIFILFSVIVNLSVPILIIIFLSKKRVFTVKYVLLGLLQYGIARFLISVLINLTYQLDIASIYTKVFVQVLVFSSVVTVSKYVLFDKVYKLPSNSSAISLGFGEAVAEVFFMIVPMAINNMVYYVKINNGTIYEYLSNVYSAGEISNFISLFSSRDTYYFLFISLMGITLILFQIYISGTIFDKLKNSLFVCMLFSFLFYTTVYLVPLFSYMIAVVAMIVLCMYFGFMHNKNLRKL